MYHRVSGLILNQIYIGRKEIFLFHTVIINFLRNYQSKKKTKTLTFFNHSRE